MNQLRVKSTMVAGTATSRTWSQVLTRPTSHGSTILVVSLDYKGEGDLVDLSEIGGSLLEHLAEKKSVAPEDLTGLGKELEVCALVLNAHDSRLSISGIGPADVYFLRDGKAGKIFTGQNSIENVSGPLHNGDRFIILTRTIANLLGVTEVVRILQAGLSEAETLAVLVHGNQDSSRMAVVMCETESTEEISPDPQPSTEKFAQILGKLRIQRPLLIYQEKRKWNMAIGLTLLFLLFIGVVSGSIRRSILIKEKSFTEMSSSVTQKMEEARSIADLNPERAKQLISQSGTEVDIYLADTKDEKYRTRAGALLLSVKQLETEVFKKEEVEISTIADLSLIKPGLMSSSMSIDEKGNLYLPDSSSSSLGGMNLSDKSTFSVDSGSLGAVKELTLPGKKIYGIVSSGIADLSTEKKVVIQPDELWREITLIDSFGNNIYLLDKGQSEIWKYPALTDGFGARRRWFGAGIQLDLSNVIDMKVDGDIWLLTSTGKLERYSRGVPADFSMEGFPSVEGDRFAGPAAVFVGETKVYVLETIPGRVVVFDKESGKYERQYASETLKSGKDMVIYEDKAYVLLQDKIVWFFL